MIKENNHRFFTLELIEEDTVSDIMAPTVIVACSKYFVFFIDIQVVRKVGDE